MPQRFDYRLLDPVIHAPVRIAIMSILAITEDVAFTALSEQLNLTDGNLATHLRKLEEEGYVQCRKSFIGRKPQTTYRILAKGRTAFGRHVAELEKIALNASER
jgi:predicted ArsR family transcriptional regulator